MQINGTRPLDMRVHDARAYRRVLTQWSPSAGPQRRGVYRSFRPA